MVLTNSHLVHPAVDQYGEAEEGEGWTGETSGTKEILAECEELDSCQLFD